MFFSSIHAAKAAEHAFTLGAEGFYDDYREPSGQLQTQSGFVSLKGSYSFKEEYYFLKAEGRVSKGKGNYEFAPSGTLRGMPQREGEFRALAGLVVRTPNGSLSPFLGLGARIYYDDSLGLVSSTGALAYDRYIRQVYIPVGLHWNLNGMGLKIDTVAEYNHLIWGKVTSYLEPTGVQNFNGVNKQREGYGLRGSLLVGPQGGRWQMGPFVRYWDISDSEIYTSPGNSTWIEPANTRLQAGVEFLYAFQGGKK